MGGRKETTFLQAIIRELGWALTGARGSALIEACSSVWKAEPSFGTCKGSLGGKERDGWALIRNTTTFANEEGDRKVTTHSLLDSLPHPSVGQATGCA